MKKKLIITFLLALMVGCAKTNKTTTVVNENITTNTTKTTETTSVSDDSTNAYFSERDMSATYDENAATKISINGNNASVSGAGATYQNGILEIGQEGVYIIEGKGENIQVLVKAADTAKIQLVLNNVTISNNDAAIYIESGDKVFITLAKGSVNTFSDNANHTNATIDAAIYSKSDLTINGEGQLVVNGNYKNGIESNDDLKLVNGTYNIKAVNHAFSVNDSFNILNSVIEIEAGADGIHNENDTDAGLGNLYVKNANITINAVDDGIHTSNNVVMDGGKIDVQTSTEGIEGKFINIISGDIYVKSSDDGFNATSASTSYGNDEAGIVIDGGNVHVDANGDGLDANGYITINGGNIYVDGPTNDGNGSLDYDALGIINGGTIFALGSSGMAQGFGSSSSQASILVNISGNSGSTINVKDSNGQVVASYQANKNFSSALISFDGMEEGVSYTVEVDGNSVSVNAVKQSSQGGFAPGARGRR